MEKILQGRRLFFGSEVIRRKMHSQLILFFSIIVFLLESCCANAAEAVVAPFSIIAARLGPNHSISPGFGDAAFAMQATTWPNGAQVQLVVLPADNAMQYQFTQYLLRLAPYQAETRWLRYVYSGQALKPIIVTSTAQMIEAVSKVPGAIGFLPSNATVPPALEVLR